MKYVQSSIGFKLGHCPFCGDAFGFSHKGTKLCSDECRVAYNNSLKVHPHYQRLRDYQIPLSKSWRLVARDLIHVHLIEECIEKLNTYFCQECEGINELFINFNYPPFDGYCPKCRIDILIQILGTE